MEEHVTSLPEGVKLPFEANAHTITPYFKHASVLNVAQSEAQGKPVYDLREVVELRFAGDRNYSPVFPVDAMYRRVQGRVVTYAERWADQYRAFLMGDDQKAGGTALEMLADYGITPAQLSICRALKIYSIEALDKLDGPNLKSLGMNANSLKAMARRYMEDRADRDRATSNDRVAALEAELAELRALVPAKETTPEEIDALVQAADDEFAAMDTEKLKAFIAKETGTRPRGNPSDDTLRSMARELAGKAA